MATAFWDELVGKWHLNAGDFVNGVVEGYIAAHVSTLKKQAGWLREAAERHNQHYLRSPGGSPEAKYNESMRSKLLGEADDVERRLAGAGRGILSKTPLIGVAITAGGVAYDIDQGKPPGKAVVSGAAGLGAAVVTGMVVSGPVGWVALAGVGAGILGGMAADYAWDHWLPDGAKDAINEGLTDLGNAIGDGAKEIGGAVSDGVDAVGDGISDAWNAVF